MKIPNRRIILLMQIVALAIPTTNGTEESANSISDSNRTERKQRLLGTLLNNELPFSNSKSTWQLRYSAKLSDLIKEQYIRLPFELRYGISTYTEAFMVYRPYLKNPLAGNPINSSGIVGVGIKRRLRDFINEDWDLAFGLKTFAPLSLIPSNDPRSQFARHEPYIVTTYKLPNNDRIRYSLHARYDWVRGEPFYQGDLDPKPSSTLYLRPGIIITPPGEWRYTLELEYQTERLSGTQNDGMLITGSIGWFPDNNSWPKRLPGEFDFTLRLGYAISQLPIDRIGSPEKIDLRIRWTKQKRN